MDDGEAGYQPSFHSFIAYRVAHLHARLNRQATHLLDKHGGVTLTQWRIIVLLESEGVATLSDMAEIAVIDKGLLSRNLSALVDLGYVSMSRDRADRRVNRLELTDKGRALHARIYPIMTWRHERLTRDLSTEQVEMIQGLFDRLDEAAADESYRP
ncbi:MAG: MarR family winged helix-turn-helix transcriptional regulator [Pseudomonadota bacterium]